MRAPALVILSVLAFNLKLAHTLQLVFEKTLLAEFNPKYMIEPTMTLVKYGGRQFLNLEGHNVQTWNNNVTMRIEFYEFVNKVFKPTFVEMHFKLCDAINSDPYIGKAIANTGVTCPILPGLQKASNITLEGMEFPKLWPFASKGQMEVTLSQTDTDERMARSYIIFNLVEKK